MSASEVVCPQCSTRLQLPPGNTATRFRCTKCRNVFEATPAVATTPAPVPAPAPAPVSALLDDDQDEREPRRRKRRRDEDNDDDRDSRRDSRREREREREREPRDGPRPARRSSGSGGLIAIIACVGSVLLVGVAVGAFFIFRDRPKEPVKVDPPAKEQSKAKEKEPPKALTQEQMIRKVKTSTVYIRTHVREGVATGTGFFAGKPGFVVTNAHVIGYGPVKVGRPTKVEVVVDSGEFTERVIPATIFGVDTEDDLALLKLEESGLPPPLAFGKAEALVETQEVVAFGYPFGESLGKNVSVNRTTVSSLRKTNGSIEIVQLSGGLNPGNSGGPVANAKGEVIGVSVAKLKGTDTIAFAIPAETAERFVADQIRVGGSLPTAPDDGGN